MKHNITARVTRLPIEKGMTGRVIGKDRRDVVIEMEGFNGEVFTRRISKLELQEDFIIGGEL